MAYNPPNDSDWVFDPEVIAAYKAGYDRGLEGGSEDNNPFDENEEESINYWWWKGFNDAEE